MDVCRVQETRRRKGLPDFPCKTVGTVEFTTFAATVDRRIDLRVEEGGILGIGGNPAGKRLRVDQTNHTKQR